MQRVLFGSLTLKNIRQKIRNVFILYYNKMDSANVNIVKYDEKKSKEEKNEPAEVVEDILPMEIQGPQTEIREGQAIIRTSGKVFYNPVQEFNRDLSITVIRQFAKLYEKEIQEKNDNISKKNAKKCEYDGLRILEALSATGLRSIRYAKEIEAVKEVIANDMSNMAFEDIKRNVASNNIQQKVTPHKSDATMLMYQHRQEKKIDVIDLDPYGCPSIFLDSAVQSIGEGGLLLVTATDMAVLAGNSPESCYVKYGAISLKIKSCHEVAVRILLQCIESHANRYGRYIKPLLSISADFYIRVFVRVFSGAYQCKFTTSKLSHLYHCTGCGSFTLHPLGLIKNKNNNKAGFSLKTGPPVSLNCEHCSSTHHIGGPLWSAPLHDQEFISEILKNNEFVVLGNHKRIAGMLMVISEELNDVPLYYTLPNLSGVIHVQTPPMLAVRSAILKAGYRVSYTHMCKTAIKTDAPGKVLWDIMRSWQKLHPVAAKRLQQNQVAANILKVEPEKLHTFEVIPESCPKSKSMGFARYPENPDAYWGPGCRSRAMVGDQSLEARRARNQGKRKRESEDGQKKESAVQKECVI